MSKQSEAKQAQGYEQKPVITVCKNCKHFKFKIEEYVPFGGVYYLDKEIRCGIGGFAIKKMATCKLYERKDQL